MNRYREKLLRQSESLRLKGRSLAKRVWMKLALRGARYSGNTDRIDLAYRVRDPWQMETDRERHRFERTNELITNNFGQLGSVFEIGCGEGHQSAYLSRVCEQLYGLDVSETAVGRARERCPDATLEVGDVFSKDLIAPTERFDLVVACEVLYYMDDVPAVLARMNELGNGCLVTYYHGHTTQRLAEELSHLPNTESAEIRYEDTSWTAVWWRTS